MSTDRNIQRHLRRARLNRGIPKPARPRAARYEVVSDEPGQPLVIRDLGPWEKFYTVTNDAENVVDELVRAGRLPPGRALHYYDSDGRLDAILVKDGAFAGFAPAGGSHGPH